jgi:putative hydrolase of the HAD superfamily
MNAVKNILFDLGAVLIDIDFEKTADAFRQLGIDRFEEQFSQLSASTLFEDLETGNISKEDVYEAMRRQVPEMNLSDDSIQFGWNAILQDFRKESMQLLKHLKSRYRLFLLSNTNAIHLVEVNKILKKQTGVENLDHYFECAYYSHLIGLRKPTSAAFNFVLEDAGISAPETLFIDDSHPNITTASQMGFQTKLLLKGEKVEDFLV